MSFKSNHIDLKILWDGFLNSYSQIFFSNNKLFAALLILTSFFDVGAGLSGAISIITAQATILLFNFDREHLKSGGYTYNVLMVGIALGIFYEFTISSLILLIIISILTLFLTIWVSVWLGKKGLPFLSIPFLLGIWIILLGASNFSTIELNGKESLSLMLWFPKLFEGTTNLVNALPQSNALHLYFRSLGAILFQYNDLAGIVIAIGILIYSRIAFGLSLFGFFIGYLFYVYFEGDFYQLIYSYIGFNFILTSIALGGFFIVPSRNSYLMLLFTIPVIAMLISALHTIFQYFNLPMYTLPFNIVTLLFISTMLTRTRTSGINLVTIQNYSPEINHYKYVSAAERLKHQTWYRIALPFMGEWRISQGHNGEITHKGEWQHAWDFDIIDEHGNTYKTPGSNVDDYYCYNLPIIAPANGYVVEIIDGVEDNKIGDVNLNENWGNLIIIKHGEYIYSKLSHLKKDSFTVKTGDYVVQGQKLATCGNSGRSPEPHLHFQLQSTPYTGSKTLEYPISYYLHKTNENINLRTFTYPNEKDMVSNIQTTKSLKEAFSFVPGKTIRFNYEGELYEWEVATDISNLTYLYCSKTNSYAYFVNDVKMFYFTDFYGKRGSLLHHFYCGAHKVLLGYYKIEINDILMVDDIFPKLLKAIHDFTAPFFHYFKVKYWFNFEKCNDEHAPTNITFTTNCRGIIGKKTIKQTSYTFIIEDDKISSFTINNEDTAKCID